MASPPLEATPPFAHIPYYIPVYNTLNNLHFIKYVPVTSLFMKGLFIIG